MQNPSSLLNNLASPKDIPIEWVDKIFGCLEKWFGDKWIDDIQDPKSYSLSKRMWQSALYGLTQEEIRLGLLTTKGLALRNQEPPSHLDFFYYCKDLTKPYIVPAHKLNIRSIEDKARAKASILEIKRIINSERACST